MDPDIKKLARKLEKNEQMDHKKESFEVFNQNGQNNLYMITATS